MIPVYQTRFGNDKEDRETVGNCYAAAVASLLEVGLDDVPDISPIEGKDFDKLWRAWFQENLGLYIIDVEVNLEIADPPKGYSIATVWSKVHEGGTHAVVTKDGHVIHDPNPNNDASDYTLKDILTYDIMIEMNPQNRFKEQHGDT